MPSRRAGSRRRALGAVEQVADRVGRRRGSPPPGIVGRTSAAPPRRAPPGRASFAHDERAGHRAVHVADDDDRQSGRSAHEHASKRDHDARPSARRVSRSPTSRLTSGRGMPSSSKKRRLIALVVVLARVADRRRASAARVERAHERRDLHESSGARPRRGGPGHHGSRRTRRLVTTARTSRAPAQIGRRLEADLALRTSVRSAQVSGTSPRLVGHRRRRALRLQSVLEQPRRVPRASCRRAVAEVVDAPAPAPGQRSRSARDARRCRRRMCRSRRLEPVAVERASPPRRGAAS